MSEKKVAFTVRAATAADLDLLAPLFDAYRQFYKKPGELDLSRRFLSDRIKNEESIIFLALNKEGTAMGFTQLYLTFSSLSMAPALTLNDLYVAPVFRRMGVAEALMEEAVKAGRRAGAVGLELSTAVTNKAAQALYEANGWKREVDYYTYSLSLRSKE